MAFLKQISIGTWSQFISELRERERERERESTCFLLFTRLYVAIVHDSLLMLAVGVTLSVVRNEKEE